MTKTNDSISKSAVIAEINRMIDDKQKRYDVAKSDEWKANYRGSCEALVDTKKFIESLPVQPTMEELLEEMPMCEVGVVDGFTIESQRYFANKYEEDCSDDTGIYTYGHTPLEALLALKDKLSN